MTRVPAWAAVAAVVAFSLVLAAQPTGPRDPDARAAAIASGLRCPVCQGLSVQDSDAETARSIRADIRRRVDAGQTDDAIRQAYVDRYSEWVLLRPRPDGFGALAWLLPPLAAAAGTAVITVALWRWRHQRGARPTAEDRRLVERALGRPL